MRARLSALFVGLVIAGAAVGLGGVAAAPTSASASAAAATPQVPHFSHVVELFLENETAMSTWEDAAAAPNLTKLRSQGVYIPNF
jgi:hypothetical protein